MEVCCAVVTRSTHAVPNQTIPYYTEPYQKAKEKDVVEPKENTILGSAAEERAIAADQKQREEDNVMVEAGGGGGGGRGATTEGQIRVAGKWGRRVDEGGGGKRGGTRGGVSDADITFGGDGEPEDYPGWRLTVWRLAESQSFQLTIRALILMNTLVLALDHHPMDQDVSTALEVFNFAFTLCFALEMVLKVFDAKFVPACIWVLFSFPVAVSHCWYMMFFCVFLRPAAAAAAGKYQKNREGRLLLKRDKRQPKLSATKYQFGTCLHA